MIATCVCKGLGVRCAVGRDISAARNVFWRVWVVNRCPERGIRQSNPLSIQILAQNREIDRQKKALATQQAQLATEASEKTSLGVERNVEAFARTQLNFSDSTGTKKRKAEDFAKPALPSFWLPSLTPNARPDILTVPATDTLCTAVDPGHKISMKKLVPVQFTGATEKETDEPSYSCPSCTKTLTNGSSISVILSCGHVLCGECMGRFVVESKRCFVCEKKCEEKDIVELKSAEGTGYSGVGRAEATKVGMGFQ